MLLPKQILYTINIIIAFVINYLDVVQLNNTYELNIMRAYVRNLKYLNLRRILLNMNINYL